MADLTFPEVLTRLVRGVDLSADEARWAMQQIFDGQTSPVQIAGFAVALRAKGESATELGALADVMMDYAAPIELTGHRVDVVGTGGDRANTVNISTMAALTATAAGARIAKHGNRAASSKCGTADVLEALGIVVDLDAAHQPQVFDEIGMVFLFAAKYHRSLRFAAAPRAELGISTTFNFLGPLSNPARPTGGAIGVADLRMAELMAAVQGQRCAQGLVFHGTDGLDELTTTAASKVWVIDAAGEVRDALFDPADLGIERASADDLVGADPSHNAAVATAVLDGSLDGPIRDIVALNAAAALLAWHGPEHGSSLADQLAAHYETANDALSSGAGIGLLERWGRLTQELAKQTA